VVLAFPIPPEQRIIRTHTGRAEQPIRTVIETAVNGVREEVDLDLLAAILAGGNLADLQAALHLDTMIGRVFVDLVPLFSDLIYRATAAGELIFAETAGVPPLDVALFRREAAVAARAMVGELITGIGAGQREAVRQIIAEGFDLGRNPAGSARLLRDVVGLDARRAGALAKYQSELEAEGRPDDQVARMVEREGRRKLRSRTLSIARTETIHAARLSQNLIWEDGVRELQLDPRVWEKEWLPVPGACPKICAPLRGKRAPIGGTYPLRGGKGPPAHPACRCAERLRRRRN